MIAYLDFPAILSSVDPPTLVVSIARTGEDRRGQVPVWGLRPRLFASAPPSGWTDAPEAANGMFLVRHASHPALVAVAKPNSQARHRGAPARPHSRRAWTPARTRDGPNTFRSRRLVRLTTQTGARMERAGGAGPKQGPDHARPRAVHDLGHPTWAAHVPGQNFLVHQNFSKVHHAVVEVHHNHPHLPPTVPQPLFRVGVSPPRNFLQ